MKKITALVMSLIMIFSTFSVCAISANAATAAPAAVSTQEVKLENDFSLMFKGMFRDILNSLMERFGMKSGFYVTGIDINKSKVTVNAGESTSLKATLEPEKVKNETINWVSEDPGVASVGSNGIVTGRKAGSTKVYAIAEDGRFYDSCIVNVTNKNIPCNGISLRMQYPYELEMADGTSKSVEMVLHPSGTTDKVVVSSSNPSLVSASYKDEKLTFNTINNKYSSGKATVTVTCGNASESINVTVVENYCKSIKPIGSKYVNLKVGESTTIKFNIIPSVTTNEIYIPYITEDIPSSGSGYHPNKFSTVSEFADIKVNQEDRSITITPFNTGMAGFAVHCGSESCYIYLTTEYEYTYYCNRYPDYENPPQEYDGHPYGYLCMCYDHGVDSFFAPFNMVSPFDGLTTDDHYERVLEDKYCIPFYVFARRSSDSSSYYYDKDEDGYVDYLDVPSKQQMARLDTSEPLVEFNRNGCKTDENGNGYCPGHTVTINGVLDFEGQNIVNTEEGKYEIMKTAWAIKHRKQKKFFWIHDYTRHNDMLYIPEDAAEQFEAIYNIYKDPTKACEERYFLSPLNTILNSVGCGSYDDSPMSHVRYIEALYSELGQRPPWGASLVNKDLNGDGVKDAKDDELVIAYIDANATEKGNIIWDLDTLDEVQGLTTGDIIVIDNKMYVVVYNEISQDFINENDDYKVLGNYYDDDYNFLLGNIVCTTVGNSGKIEFEVFQESDFRESNNNYGFIDTGLY